MALLGHILAPGAIGHKCFPGKSFDQDRLTSSHRPAHGREVALDVHVGHDRRQLDIEIPPARLIPAIIVGLACKFRRSSCLLS